FVASRVLGLGREMVIAYYYGSSPALGAYVAAFRVPDLLFQILASGAFASAFMPVFTAYIAQRRMTDAWVLASSTMNLLLILSIVLALGMALAAPLLVPIIVPGFTDPGLQQMVVNLTRIMLLTPVFFSLSSTLTAILQGRQHFVLPSVAPILYNLAIIAGAVLLSDSRGVYGLAVGVALGSMLHAFVQVPVLLRLGMRWRPIVALDHPGVREVGKLLLPRSIGLGATQIVFVAYTALASTLGAETIAALNWAWLLMMMPLGIFGMSIATAVFPTLTDHAAMARIDSLRRTLAGSLRLILFLTIPASVGLILLREPIVGLLFERGQFDARSTQLTAYALFFFAMGLYAHSIVEIVTRGFYALHDTRTPVMISLGSIVVNIALSLGLVRVFQHGGLALAMSVATTLEAMVMLTAIRNRLGGLEDDQLTRSVTRTLFASAAMAAVVLLVTVVAPIDLSPVWRRLVVVGASVVTGGLTYLAVAYFLGSQELQLLLGVLRRRR
ncbi:MAG: murein biosynthesis integral membrane protein MurJ, partial [Chloroflexi bacterium]|nr:murein biosynthesis integral membrane protein MurJ [Chloroflexota bacterium]